MASETVVFTRAHLNAFADAISGDGYHHYETVRDAFRALPHQALTVFDNHALCVAFLTKLDALVAYMPKTARELTYDYSTKDHIMACADGHIEATLRGVKDWRTGTLTLPEIDAQSALEHLPNWHTKKLKAPWQIAHRLWWERSDGRALLGKVYAKLMAAAEVDGQVPKGTTDAIGEAYAIYRAKRDDRDWPERAPHGSVKAEILPLARSEHSVMRNLCGMLLGETYALATEEEIAALGGPSHSAIFKMVAELDAQFGDIAPAFIDGARLQVEPVSTLANLPHDVDFDLRAWLLGIITQHKGEDAIIGQPLWFPMHEHFSADLDAVMEMIDCGHFFMAKMTAEEDWFAHMRPAVERIAREADEDNAAAAHYSLKHWWPKQARDMPEGWHR
ncbi:MAG: hypothetical protein AAFO77_05985 [Pseudomonadota bacterium]